MFATQVFIIHFKTTNNNGNNLQIGSAQRHAQGSDSRGKALLRPGKIGGDQRHGTALLHDQRTQHGIECGREGGIGFIYLCDETGAQRRQDREAG